MRTWRRPLIYFFVVMSVAGFAFYQYKKSEKEKIAEEKETLVFSEIQPSEVQSISISQEEGSIYLIRKEQGWWMESPVKDLADAESVESWLDTLFTEKIKVIKEKGVNWAEYDLQDPIRFLEITMKSDEKFKLSISKYSAFDGSFYIRKGEQLLLGETSWAGIARKKEKDFRSYKLLNIGTHPASVSYKSKVFSADLLWHNYKWEWKEKEQKKFPLSKSQLESYWSSLANIYFEKEVYPDTEPLRKKYQLVSPDIQLEVEFEKNRKWSVRVSPEMEGKFYALVSTRDYIFTLNEDQREKILLTEKKFRDHSHPFLFKEDQVQFIEIKGYGVDIQMKKGKGKWEQLSSENKETINRKKLDNVLRRIRTLSAEEYFDPKKSFKSVAHLILKNKEGDILLKLESGDPFKLKKEDDTRKNEMVYVRSNLGQELMALRFNDLKPVFSSLIKSEKKENKKDKIEDNLKAK